MKLVKLSACAAEAQANVKLFTNVRNELPRLAYFLEYYREQGVEEFYIVDNNSTDETVGFLAGQSDVTLYSTDQSFINSRCGLDWLDLMRNKYADDSWCLTVDCDELLVFPGSDYLRIPNLCEYLDQNGYQGLFTIMLDCYANKTIDSYTYSPGQNFIEACPFIDAQGYYVRQTPQFPYFGLFGGPRYRAFYKEEGARQGPTLRKIPLVKWNTGVEYLSVTHSTTPMRLADITGALLHFKYLDNFLSHVKSEVVRNDRQMKDYKQYLATLNEQPNFNFFCDHSAEYENPIQLAELGLIRSSMEFLRWTDGNLDKLNRLFSEQYQSERKRYKQVLGAGQIPESLNFSDFTQFWNNSSEFDSSRLPFELSVVMPVYNGAEFLTRSIKSVVNQAQVSELVIVDDGSTDNSLDIVNSFVEKYPWITLYQHPNGENRGAGASRNLGIEMSSGNYIAFLDADDFYLPGRFDKQKQVLLGDASIDGVYGAQNFEFASDELRQAREQRKLSMLTTIESHLPPEQLFCEMNPIGKQGSFHCNTLTVRKSIFDKVGNFWDLRTEDVQMWLKMAYASKLVGVELNKAISSKYVHHGNRMNPSTTREYRHQVLKSVIVFSQSKKDNYQSLKKLLERYFYVLKSNVLSELPQNELESATQKFLTEIVDILIKRISKYEHVLGTIGENTNLYSRDDLTRVITKRMRLHAPQEGLDSESESGNDVSRPESSKNKNQHFDESLAKKIVKKIKSIF